MRWTLGKGRDREKKVHLNDWQAYINDRLNAYKYVKKKQKMYREEAYREVKNKKERKANITWKMSVFRVILVRIFPHSDGILFE